MKGVDTIARIRREHFVHGRSIKEIVRALHVSRNTVRKVLRSGKTAFAYEREVQPLPKLGQWRVDLDELLVANGAKASRERLTMMRIFETLRGLGYEGGYDAVRRYARNWRREHAAVTAQAYVPLTFDPGEAYQFDWSHDVVLINGTTVTVKVAHVRLCHSRMLFVRAYPRESQEMVFDAHDRAFAFFKGACRRGIYDNMKTAVETIFAGKERAYNRRFLQMCGHYLVDPVACTPASGWEKGQKREPGRPGAGALLLPAAPREELRRVERVAARPVRGLRQGPSASRVQGPHGLAGLRGGAAEPGALRRPVRRFPRGAGIGVEDLPGPLRQQQVLGHRERGRPPSRGPGLRRADRAAPGRPGGRRPSSLVRSQRERLLPLALRSGAGAQAGRSAERSPFKDWVLPAGLDRVRRKLAGVDDGDR